MQRYDKIFYNLIISIFLLFIPKCFASTDNKNLITLDSNSATCEYQGDNTTCSYKGDAKLDQKSMLLEAQKITLHKTGDKFDKIVASGKNSRYSSNQDKNQKINASANLITIYPDKNIMTLEGNGKLSLGKDNYNGPHITYKFKQK